MLVYLKEYSGQGMKFIYLDFDSDFGRGSCDSFFFLSEKCEEFRVNFFIFQIFEGIEKSENFLKNVIYIWDFQSISLEGKIFYFYVDGFKFLIWFLLQFFNQYNFRFFYYNIVDICQLVIGVVGVLVILLDKIDKYVFKFLKIIEIGAEGKVVEQREVESFFFKID